MDISGDDFHKLARKYDLQESGRFSYVEFLRHFVLTLKPQEDRGRLKREKMVQPKIAVSSSTHVQLASFMVNIHACPLVLMENQGH